MMLPHRTLGRTGIEVATLGYGSMGIRGPRTWGVRVVSDEDADHILNAVLDAGINFIDTAPDYGLSEERIGKYISSRRDEFCLATKCGCDYVQHADELEIQHTWRPDVIRRNVETSLNRLRTDSIDLLQFHGGDAETLQRQGLIDLLHDLREQGLIRFIGVSSRLPDLPGLIELKVFDAFQIPYSCLAPEHFQLITEAAATGAGIIIRGGVAQGGPDAEIQRPQLNALWARAKLDELLTDEQLPRGITRAQFILRYTLAHPHVATVIVGTCNPSHLAENIAAAQAGPLPTELCKQVARRVAALENVD